MNESITRAAGASYGQELHPERMEELIRYAFLTGLELMLDSGLPRIVVDE